MSKKSEAVEKRQKKVFIPQPVEPVIEEKSFMDVVTSTKLFSAEECRKIIWERKPRDSQMLDMEENTEHIFERIMATALGANDHIFHFDVNYFAGIQFVRHKKRESEPRHFNVGGGGPNDNIKLVVAVPLSDPASYGGGDLVISFDNFATNREIGSATIFPSFLAYEVTPVTKGTRYSLVARIGGNVRFK